MSVEQLYTNCLAQGAYFIHSNGEAAVIDPLRDPSTYIDLANKQNVKIKYVFETHFHADFVSGHVDLANKTGATIVYGPTAQTSYKSHIAKDNEVFMIGDLTIKVLHTPGHTPESSCYLLIDKAGKETALFSGDTLFIGDVGRPDLAVKSDLTQEDLAGMLYESLRHKIMTLPDDVVVYPAHGAGSACGKNLSKETSDTLGNQKKTNYALQNLSKAEFIKELTTGILPAPQYFPKNATINKTGYDNFDVVLNKGAKTLSIEQFEDRIKEGALILDVRKPNEFIDSHIPNALFIGIDGQFAPWVGALIKNINQEIILVAPEGRAEEAVVRLARVGYDNCTGYLDGGITTWVNANKPIETIETITAPELENIIKSGTANVLDVRKPGEYDSSHLEIANHQPLDYIEDWGKDFEDMRMQYVHCAGGYRSVIAISILKQLGKKNLVNVAGGYDAILKTALPKVESACSSTK